MNEYFISSLQKNSQEITLTFQYMALEDYTQESAMGCFHWGSL